MNFVIVCQEKLGRVFSSVFVKEKYFWKMACLFCTGWLLMQIMMDFFILRPTFTAVEDVKLSQIHFPDVLVCLENGFDQKQLQQYEYDASFRYFLGWSRLNNFVGWSGLENKESRRKDLDK